MSTQREAGHLQAEDRGPRRNLKVQTLDLRLLISRMVRQLTSVL